MDRLLMRFARARQDPPAAFDFNAYLNFLGRHGHNFGAPQEILEFQKAYVRQVIGMVNYLHSVLYERKRPDWQMRKVTR